MVAGETQVPVEEEVKLSEERMRFVLPIDKEASIAALAAIQSYEFALDRDWTLEGKVDKVAETYDGHKITQRAIPRRLVRVIPEFHIQGLDEELVPYVLPGMPKERYTVYKPGRKVVSPTRWDLDFFFDDRLAERVATNPDWSLAEAYATLLGTDLLSQFPRVLVADEVKDKVALLGFSENKDWGWLQAYGYLTKSMTVICPTEFSEEVYSCEYIIGPRSEYTYLAAARGAKVIELVNGARERVNRVPKFDNPYYRVILVTEDISTVRPDLIVRVLEDLR